MKSKILAALLFVVLIGIYPFLYMSTSEVIEIKINKTERVTIDSVSKYMVYTDNEVFENTDSWLYGKFNSADFYAKMKEGSVMKVRVAGMRWAFNSWYRNIVQIIEEK